MASKNITTPAGRERLAPRPEPYYTKISKGQHIGYRKNARGGTWVARYTTGKTKTHHKIGSDRELREYADALAAAQTWFKLITDGEALTGPYSVKQCVADYVGDVRLRRGNDAAKRTEQVANKHIVPALGELEASKLRSRRITQWRDSLVKQSDDTEEKRRSMDTANRVLTILKAALNRAYQEKTIASDDEWRRVKPFKQVGRSRDVFLTLQQCGLLVAACPDDFAQLVTSAQLTGARYSELTERTVADFDPKQGILHVENGKTGPRDIVLNNAGLRHFRQLAKDKLPTAYLHIREDGEPWNRAHQSRRMSNAVKAANKKIRKSAERLPADTVFYSLRHTHASLALLGGINIQVLAENMGTSVLMIEKHYGKFLRADRRKMFNTVSFQ